MRRNPDTVRAADVAYISNERLAQVQSQSYLDVAPELVVEIMSPSDTWEMVQSKLDDYFSADVLEVWIVDPAHERVHVYTSETAVSILTTANTLQSTNILPGFALPLAELFSE